MDTITQLDPVNVLGGMYQTFGIEPVVRWLREGRNVTVSGSTWCWCATNTFARRISADLDALGIRHTYGITLAGYGWNINFVRTDENE